MTERVLDHPALSLCRHLVEACLSTLLLPFFLLSSTHTYTTRIKEALTDGVIPVVPRPA